MRHGMMRRSLAAASAAAMAGAALVVGGAGVASAAEVSASQEYSGAFASKFRVTRTISEGSPTYGDTVTVHTRVERTSLGDLLYGVRDYTPDCFQRVPGTASAQARGGALIHEGNREFSYPDGDLQWNGPGVGPWFWMETDYTVLCDAGRVPTDGAEFASVAGQYRGSETLGPTITVNRATVSEFFLAAPGALEVGTSTMLRVNTNAPEGSTITFTVDGETLEGTVNGGVATAQWTPRSAGEKTIRAAFAQTSTHHGKSEERKVSVAEQIVDSEVVIDAPATAQVGVRSELTATVSPAGAGGTVTFKEEGKIIASADVPASGTVTIDWVPEVEGDRSIDAEFSGRAGVNGSTAFGAKVNVTPKPAEMQQSTTSLAQVGMVDLGDTVTLQATVDPAAGGTVKFYDGNTLLDEVPVGENGVATLAWKPTTEGERTIRAVFSGTETVVSSQAATQAIITSATDTPEPGEPADPGTPGGGSGSLGSLTGSLGGESDGMSSGSTGSLSAFGS